MKKLFLALLALMAFVSVSAQNANRKGFFIEAAVGGTTGSTPRVALALDGTNLYEYYASGASFNIAFGPRIRTSNHVAIDFRFEVQAPLSYVTTVPTVKFMPAVRYTSKEIFGNMSAYVTLGIGGALGFNYTSFGDYDSSRSNYLLNDGSKHKLSLFDDNPELCAGASYVINLGLNVTTHFYAGLMYDAQLMFSQASKNNRDMSHWGMCGVQLGYRF